MCLYPKILPNRKYQPNKKNEGIVPELKDTRAAFVAVGCGKCIECTKQRANNWRIRLLEEIKYNKNYSFITLTFDNQSFTKLSKDISATGYDLDNEIATQAVS